MEAAWTACAAIFCTPQALEYSSSACNSASASMMLTERWFERACTAGTGNVAAIAGMIR
jgi:hypothetical protein